MQCNMILYGKRHRGVMSMVWRVVGYRAACRHLQVLHQEQEQEEGALHCARRRSHAFVSGGQQASNGHVRTHLTTTPHSRQLIRENFISQTNTYSKTTLEAKEKTKLPHISNKSCVRTSRKVGGLPHVKKVASVSS